MFSWFIKWDNPVCSGRYRLIDTALLLYVSPVHMSARSSHQLITSWFSQWFSSFRVGFHTASKRIRTKFESRQFSCHGEKLAVLWCCWMKLDSFATVPAWGSHCRRRNELGTGETALLANERRDDGLGFIGLHACGYIVFSVQRCNILQYNISFNAIIKHQQKLSSTEF